MFLGESRSWRCGDARADRGRVPTRGSRRDPARNGAPAAVGDRSTDGAREGKVCVAARVRLAFTHSCSRGESFAAPDHPGSAPFTWSARHAGSPVPIHRKGSRPRIGHAQMTMIGSGWPLPSRRSARGAGSYEGPRRVLGHTARSDSSNALASPPSPPPVRRGRDRPLSTPRIVAVHEANESDGGPGSRWLIDGEKLSERIARP